MEIIILDHEGNIVKEACKYIGNGTNNNVEFHAHYFGSELAISLKIKDIIIEGDSMVTFYVVSN